MSLGPISIVRPGRGREIIAHGFSPGRVIARSPERGDTALFDPLTTDAHVPGSSGCGSNRGRNHLPELLVSPFQGCSFLVVWFPRLKPWASMRRFALSTGKEPRVTSVSGRLRPGFHPHSLRRLSDAVLFEVRPFRRCSLSVGLACGPAHGRSRRELSVWACPSLSLPFLYLANSYRLPRPAHLVATHPAVAGRVGAAAVGAGGCSSFLP